MWRGVAAATVARMAVAGSPRRTSDERPALEPAGAGARFAAAVVDWLLVSFAAFVLVAALPQIFFSTGGAESGMAALALVPVVLVLLVAVYFGVGWARGGRTVGMLVFSLRLVERRSGRSSRPARAVARAGFTVATFASVVVLLFLAEASSPDEEVTFAAGHYAALALAAAVTALAFAGHLAGLLDPGGSSLQDRLLGLGVERVREEAGRPAGAPAMGTAAARTTSRPDA
jgi:uncharacterized RDD family membrane protein YckC